MSLIAQTVNKRFAVVVVHFGDVADTMPLLLSLEQDRSVPKIYVVDNGPDQLGNDWSKLQRSVPIESPNNDGYGGGANRGIRRALADGYHSVVVIATDAVVAPGVLAQLVRRGIAAGATVAGPRIVYEDGRTIWADGIAFSDRWAVSKNQNKGKAVESNPAPSQTNMLTGHVLALFDVGDRPWLRFDDRFFMYYEDVDLCRRVADRGERVWLDPETTVRHRKPGGVKYRFGAVQQFNMSRSAVLYHRRYSAGFGRVTAGVGLVALTVYRMTRSRNAAASRAAVAGLIDGLRASRVEMPEVSVPADNEPGDRLHVSAK